MKYQEKLDQLKKEKKELENYLRHLDRRYYQGKINKEDYEALLYDRFAGTKPHKAIRTLELKIKNLEKRHQSHHKTKKIVRHHFPTTLLTLILVISLGVITFNLEGTPTGLVSLEALEGEESFNENISSEETFIFAYKDLIEARATGLLKGKATITLLDEEGNEYTVLNASGENEFSEHCLNTCSLNPLQSTRIKVKVTEGWLYLEKINYKREGVAQKDQIPDLTIYQQYELDLSQYFEKSLAYSLETEIPFEENGTNYTLLPNKKGEFTATAYAIGIEEVKTQEFKISVLEVNPEKKKITADRIAKYEQSYEQQPAVPGQPVQWKSLVKVENQPARIIIPVHSEATNIIVKRLDSNSIINKEVVVNNTNKTLSEHNQQEAINNIDSEIRKLVEQMKQAPRERAKEISDEIQELEKRKKEVKTGKNLITGDVILATNNNGFLARLIRNFFSKITGNVVGATGLTIHLPKQEYEKEEEIKFTILPTEAEASIYIHGPGHTGYITSRTFTSEVEGEYKAVALITHETQVTRLELPFKIGENVSNTTAINATILTINETETNTTINDSEINETTNQTIEEPEKREIEQYLGKEPLLLVIPAHPAIEITYETPSPTIQTEITDHNIVLTVRSPYPYEKTRIKVNFQQPASVARVTSSINGPIENVRYGYEEGQITTIEFTDDIISLETYTISSKSINSKLYHNSNKIDWSFDIKLEGKDQLEITPYPKNINLEINCGEQKYNITEQNCEEPKVIVSNAPQNSALFFKLGDAQTATFKGSREDAIKTTIERSIKNIQTYNVIDPGSVIILHEANKNLKDERITKVIDKYRTKLSGNYLVFNNLINGTVTKEEINESAYNLTYNNNFIPALTCEERKLDKTVFERTKKLNDNGILGYDILHGLYILTIIKERNCYNNKEVQNAIQEKVKEILPLSSSNNDILLEKYALLTKAGVKLSNSEIDQIIKLQHHQGGYEAVTDTLQNPHTTSLALWALSTIK